MGKDWAKVYRNCRDSERLTKLLAKNGFAEAIYWRLKAHADDFGRYLGDAHAVAAGVCPRNIIEGHFKLRKVEQALSDMQECGLIAFYEVDGKKYLEIVDYNTHAHDKWANIGRPEYPAPPDWQPPADLVDFLVANSKSRNVTAERYGIGIECWPKGTEYPFNTRSIPVEQGGNRRDSDSDGDSDSDKDTTDGDGDARGCGKLGGKVENSGSVAAGADWLKNWTEKTATALGRPDEAKQLLAWCKRHNAPADILEAALGLTSEACAVKEVLKPIAYLQSTANALLESRAAKERQTAAVLETRQQEARAQFLGLYRDDMLFQGNVTSCEAIVAQTWGIEAAQAVVAALREEGALNSENGDLSK
jgi:hypothetical protein